MLTVGYGQEDNKRATVYSIEVEGMVTAGTTSHIQRGIEMAEEEGAEALLILLNTPGGLVNATLDIVSDMINADVPIITYVYPDGGIAASAGTFILLGGHKAVMAPGTTIGAAMPVTMSPEGEGEPADDKTVQFLAGHIRSIAESRNRPADVAERFVTENLTLSGREAIELEIIDDIAEDIPALLEDIDGLEFVLKTRTVTLNTDNAEIQNIEKNTRDTITHLISNPQIAFILFLLGVYGLVIGFNAPETFFPEVLGAIALVLALYGLGLFEVNVFAAIMILLGVGLIIAEAYTPTYGVLGTGGVISMIFGIVYLPVEPLASERWLAEFRTIAIGVAIIASVLLIVIVAALYRLKKSKVIHGDDEFADIIGIVNDTIDPEGLIKVQGEIWRAKSKDAVTIQEGEKVRILNREGMVCIVEKEQGKHDERERKDK
ncbi:NfeD family protein [Isachenkonia alkalipeptolytica]|nr:nodulation protein NfeD [Isachenkonia alkalipeptolytica]